MHLKKYKEKPQNLGAFLLFPVSDFIYLLCKVTNDIRSIGKFTFLNASVSSKARMAYQLQKCRFFMEFCHNAAPFRHLFQADFFSVKRSVRIRVGTVPYQIRGAAGEEGVQHIIFVFCHTVHHPRLDHTVHNGRTPDMERPSR